MAKKKIYSPVARRGGELPVPSGALLWRMSHSAARVGTPLHRGVAHRTARRDVVIVAIEVKPKLVAGAGDNFRARILRSFAV